MHWRHRSLPGKGLLPAALSAGQTEGLCVDEEEPDTTVPSQWKQKQASGVWTSEEKVENEPMYETLGGVLKGSENIKS